MIRPVCLALLLSVAAAAGGLAADPVHHDLRVRLDPARHAVEVRDTVTLPAGAPAGPVHLLLHGGLGAEAGGEGVGLERLDRPPAAGDFLPGTAAERMPGGVPLELYRVSLPTGVRTFSVRYAGPIDHPVEDVGEEYARNFGVTPGLVAEEGVFLSGSSAWVPWLGGDGLVTFSLTAEEPSGWKLVSQGRRAPAADASVRWECPEPQDEVYLVGGPLTEYEKAGGEVQNLAYLRTPDAALAARYLDATERYLAMYAALLGPYPYPKFALVENFWETGYGMPSFTLLGPQILRFPFLLTSSYPHEVLHNWWGNGVYVDYAGGNWAEGLTAYLSDHLFQEQKGEGAEHRLATLQKYADYAARQKDFPLTGFLGRRSAATEAVGYGKALMFFHMLRRELGDEAFTEGLRRFYRDNRFRFASYADLRSAFEAASGRDLGAAFRQWVERPGAPALRIAGARVDGGAGGWSVRLDLDEIQGGEPYRLEVPVAVTMEGRAEAHWTTVSLAAARGGAKLKLPARPLRIDVDPEFDLFRLLDRRETPPALSGLFGADRALIVLPASAPAPLLAAYRALAEDWAAAKPGQVDVRLDAEVEGFPSDRAVWVFGWENRLLGAFAEAARGLDAAWDADGVRLGRSTVPRRGGAAVAAARHPGNAGLPVAWLAADDPAALPGLGRKLPHYHKWSYLGFEGAEPTNTVKGRWPVAGSPLTVFLRGADEGGARPERGRLPARRALAELPPAFSKEAMLGTVAALASDDLAGRAAGSPGAARAAEFLAARMKDLGLAPGAQGGYVQEWVERPGEAGEVRLRNVVGVIPGRSPDRGAVVVGAHYDGQGLGLPGGRSEDRGRVHPGADDNASGVAVLLELARALRDAAPERPIVFAAFDGEEAGRLGSRRVAAEARSAVAMLNLDTVGRLGKGKLLALGTGSAREWAPILQGAGYVAGAALEPVSADAGGSDQVSFLDVGVPAVQLFTGPHLDYHRPGDTADRIDGGGLVKVAAVAREVVAYLAGRTEPLTRPGADAPAPGRAASGEGRRVSLGTMPDFAWQGGGLRLSGVVPGSPAEAAGLQEGDVIVGLGEARIGNLKDFSEALKARSAGDLVRVTFRRGTEEKTVEATIEAR